MKFLWEQTDKSTRINSILDGEFIFFFVYDKELYGAPEGSRVTYAKMRDKNDEDNTKGWLKEANFMASNLYKCLDGENNHRIFGYKELNNIHVITDKKEVEKMLEKK
jgi:hypothetical protein